MGKLIVVVGGQYGSEAKGHVCAYLGEREDYLLAIRVGGPNAGHTVVDTNGRHWPFRHIPVAAVRPARRATSLAIAAGSEVDYGVLHDELYDLEKEHIEPFLTVDTEATLLEERHRAAEAGGLTGSHGSTQKGIGAARSDRLLRKASRTIDNPALKTLGHHVHFGDVSRIAHDHLHDGGTVLIEGTQGYKLGMHAGDYPFCTSGNARAVDFMSQAGISPWDPAITELEIWVVFRTFPIRIAGNSGPMRGELQWGEGPLTNIAPEFTTVTKKMRRVGEWDHKLAWDAIRANGSDVHIALTFFDYVYPEFECAATPVGLSNHWPGPRFESGVNVLEDAWFGGRQIELVGTGPSTIVDRRKQ